MPTTALGCYRDPAQPVSPAAAVQRNSKIRMMSGIGIPTSQSRIGMVLSSVTVQSGLSGVSVGPRSVAKSAAFHGSEGRRERSDEERKRQPDRRLHRRLASAVQVGLRLGHDIVDALFGVGLAEARARGYDFGNVCPVGRIDIVSGAEV
jgi:hypothetical protein